MNQESSVLFHWYYIHITYHNSLFTNFNNCVQVIAANTADDLKQIFAEDEAACVLLESGYRKVLLDLVIDDKEEIANILGTYHTLVKVKGPIDQFITGLQCIDGLHEYIKKYPETMKPLFVRDQTKKLTAGKSFEYRTLMYTI